MKRQPMKWKEIFVDDVTKGLICKIKSSYNWILKKKKNLSKTWAEVLNRHFSEENIDDQQACEKMLSIANY